MPLPDDPTELYVADLPPVGCNQLHCRNCKSKVRNAPGVSFGATREPPFTEVYELADPRESPLLHPILPIHRLYFCRCNSWLEERWHVVYDPDDEDDVRLPYWWRCAGHPNIELPHDIHGVRVETRDQLRELITRGFHGFDPPGVSAGEIVGQWLARLYYRLADHDAALLVSVVTECFADPDPIARQRALHVLDNVRDSAARERLAELLETRRDLYSDTAETKPLWKMDKTLEHTAWRVLSEAFPTSARARSLARADALRGRASRALYDGLSVSDTEWVKRNAEIIALAAPNDAEKLETSFQVGPSNDMVHIEDYKALRGRARNIVAIREQFIAAWDYEDVSSQRLAMYRVGAEGAHQVAEGAIDEKLCEDLVDALTRNGIRVGGCYAGTDVVWVVDELGFAVWNKTSCLAQNAAADIARVHVCYEAYTSRLQFDLSNGGARVIAEQPLSPPTFPSSGGDELYLDTLWAHYLGLHLALWHDVDLENDVTQASIADDRAVRRAALALASRVTADTDELSLSLGALGRATEFVIRVTAGEQVRSVETHVTISGSSEWLIRVVKQGPSEQVAAFLRRVTTPSALLRAMNDLINKALA